MDKPEISIRRLAEIYAESGREIMNYTGKVKFAVSDDADYLKNNPNRRCPDLTRARNILKYSPKIDVEQGVRRFLEYIKQTPAEALTW